MRALYQALTFLAVAIVLSGVTAAAADTTAPDAVWRVYIGTYTGGASEGIYQLELDASNGAVTVTGLAAATENPSFLALHPALPTLYAVGEMGGGGVVSAFAVDAMSGALEIQNAQSSEGAGPCHVAVSPNGAYVAVANYSGGNVALMPIEADGTLAPAISVMQHEGASVHPQRQQRPHAHAVIFDPEGRHLFVADLGIDRLMAYRVDAVSGGLEPNEPAYAALAPGAGPRHFAFHPSGDFAYSVNELDNTVTAFAYDSSTGTLETLQSITTLPEGFEEPNTTAEIRVHPSGRFLYASNRGHDSIAAFSIDPESGRLEALGQTSTGGQMPRNFNLDPEGQWLLAANQRTDNVVVFAIDADSGSLTPTGQEVTVPAPVCVVFVPQEHPAAQAVSE